MQEIQQIAVTAMPPSSVWEIWAAGMKMWLDVLTAFGTVGAVAVALWIALRDGRERKRVQRSNALVTGWLVAPELGELKTTFLYLRQFLNQIQAETAVGQPISDGMRRLLAYAASRMQLTSSGARLAYLADLESDTGAAIAALVGQVPKIQSSVQQIASHPGPLTDSDLGVITKLLEGCNLIESYLAAVNFDSLAPGANRSG